MVVSEGGYDAASEAIPGFVQMGRKMIVRGPSEQPIGMNLPAAYRAAVIPEQSVRIVVRFGKREGANEIGSGHAF